MAAIRAVAIFVTLLGFFLVGAPAQWLVARYLPRQATRIPLLFSRSLLWLLKVELTVEGQRVVGRPVMSVANHVSWIDILALGAVMPFCFLAKSEVGRWPILSAFADVQGTVFVDRKRRRTIPEANKRMAVRMREGRSVLLFPEGTTRDAAVPGRFRTSHFAAARELLQLDAGLDAVQVQPVSIIYSSAAAAWVGDDALVPHIWRTLRAPPLRCVLAFAPPIPYAAGGDRKAIARTAREAIIERLRREHPAEVPEAAGVPADLAATRC